MTTFLDPFVAMQILSENDSVVPNAQQEPHYP